MSHGLEIALTALLWGGSGALGAWLLTWPFRRRSQPGALLSVAIVTTAASVSAVIGNTRAMFLTLGDEYVTISVAVMAGLLSAIAALGTGRRFSRDTKSVHEAVDALRAGRVPEYDGRRLSGELHRLRTELDSTARQLADTRERERILESSRRELVAWVSHDLRTPLAGLRAMAEALEDGIAESPDRYHKQIRIEVDRLAVMVDDLFEISRLQAGAPSSRSERVDLDDLVSDCVAALEPVATLQRVTLTRQPVAGAALGGDRSASGQEVIGSSAELSRALTNLLINAIRHSAPGAVVAIGISSEGAGSMGAGSNGTGSAGAASIGPGSASAGAGSIGTGSAGAGAGATGTCSMAQVRVRDQCGGIASHDLPRLFEVGFRGEQARTPTHGLDGNGPSTLVLAGGAGLGLAITRGIVVAHQGSVEVANTADGCEFTVRLPLAA